MEADCLDRGRRSRRARLRYVIFGLPRTRPGLWSRIYLAKSEIAAIETAAESFHKDRGSYPTDLQELVHKAGDSGSDRQFLVRIPTNPWGGSFRYEVEHGRSGESIRIWAVPDRKTQDKLGIAELSNKTNWRAILKP